MPPSDSLPPSSAPSCLQDFAMKTSQIFEFHRCFTNGHLELVRQPRLLVEYFRDGNEQVILLLIGSVLRFHRSTNRVKVNSHGEWQR